MKIETFARELPRFQERVAALRATHQGANGADRQDVLEATLLELELAQEELRVCCDELIERELGRAGDAEGDELRRVLHELTTPVAVLDHRGKIRSANRAATAALPLPTGRLPGNLFVMFVDMPARAVFRTRLAAVCRDGGSASFRTQLVRADSTFPARLTLTRIAVTSPATPLVIVQIGADTADAQAEPERPAPAPPGADTAARGDLMAAMARLLISDEFMSEPGLLTQAARLMTPDFADWAVADLTRDRGPCRLAVEGSGDEAGRTGERLLQRQDPLDSPLPLRVAETGAAVLQSRVEDETSLGSGGDGTPIMLRLGVGSLLIVPIKTTDGVDGALTLIRRTGRLWFTLADGAVAKEIGEQLGIALRSARRRRRSMVVTRTLQRSLLPPALPAIPGVEAAAAYAAAVDGLDVGGDFYDVFPSRSGWGVVLGDVCGRGEEAAAITALVRHGTRVIGRTSDHPEDVLRQINEAMSGAISGERFATAVAGHLRWSGSAVRVRLAGAGHPPAAVLRADGSVEFTAGGGLPLGAFAHIDPKLSDVSLQEGDILVLYTDGVTEARDPQGNFYTDARLTEVLLRGAGLSAAELVKSIERDVVVFTDGRGHDDLALLALRVVQDPALTASGPSP